MKKRLSAALICAVLLFTGCVSKNEPEETLNEEHERREPPQIVRHAENVEEESDMLEHLKNPIVSIQKETWYDYGTGDPFVMRWNGEYYLYMSTRDNETGVKCFISRDLVNWNYCGLCSTEDITKGAYAPEVYYYNGNFYMYTSPAGQGHYVLKSESPTGPFVKASENLGLSIDGSVFMADDGKWYFYHAGGSGIEVNRMTSPVSIEPFNTAVNARMGGWTEGPMVIQENGRYFITYTGNHVLSKGYRINYSVGSSPVNFQPSEENPILIHTTGDIAGIGHSSTVKGPDLDSFYIVYHTLVGRASEGMPKREMNVDRIAFNGDRLDILGPTNTPQQLPDMPLVAEWFDDWLHLSADTRHLLEGELGADFTAEFNLALGSAEGSAGGLFLFRDEDNYGCFRLRAGSQNVEVTVKESGAESVYSFPLIQSFDEPAALDVIQTFQIERSSDTAFLYFQDRLIGTFPCTISQGQLGYFTEGCDGWFGFLGGSPYSGGNSIKTYSKPIPGTVQGVHCLSASDNVQATEGSSSTEDIRGSGGSWADYRINVERTDAFDFAISYASESGGAARLYLDNAVIMEDLELHPTGDSKTQHIVQKYGVQLSEGEHTLRLEWDGSVTISEFSFSRHEDVVPFTANFDEFPENILAADGQTWSIRDGVLTLAHGDQPVGKQVYGSEAWRDYEVSVDVTAAEGGMDAGIIFRVNNPATGGAGDDPMLGTYFFQGYYAGITERALVLYKVNYGREELAQTAMEFELNRTYRITARAQGNDLTILVDGEVCMEYTDDRRPFLCGAVGVRGLLCSCSFDNLDLRSIEAE